MGKLCGCNNGNDPHLGRTTINLWPPGGVGAAGVGTDTITSNDTPSDNTAALDDEIVDRQVSIWKIEKNTLAP